MADAQFTAQPTPLGFTPANLDLASQLAEIERQRQLMSGLLIGSIQAPLQQVGGGAYGPIAVRRSPLEWAARAFTGLEANQGLQSLAAQQQGLAATQAQKAAAALNDLGNAAQPDLGTPTMITEAAGPPTPEGLTNAQGQPEPTATPFGAFPPGTPFAVSPGTAGHGVNMPAVMSAAQRAIYAGADPNMVKMMTEQAFGTNMLGQLGLGGGQSGPTFTPGDANSGAAITLPPPGTTASLLASGAPATPGSIPPAIARAAPLLIAGQYMPALGKIGEEMMKVAEPADVRPGAMRIMADGSIIGAPDANGVQIHYDGHGNAIGSSVVPGAEQAAASRAGAVTAATRGAQAPTEIVTVQNDNGTTTQMPLSQYLQSKGITLPLPNGAPAPNAGVPSPQLAPPNAQVTPLTNQQRALAISQGGGIDGATGQPITPPPTQNALGVGFAAGAPDPQSAAAAAAGVAGAAPPTKRYLGDIPTLPTPPVVSGTSQTPEARATAEAMGKQTVDRLNEVNAAGNVAADLEGRYKVIGQLGDQTDTGAFAPALNEVGRAAIALGIDPNTVQSFTGMNTPTAEAFNKLTMQTAAEGVKQQLSGSRVTQFEFSKFLENYPNLAMTPQGRRMALAIMQGSNQYALARQDAANDYFNQNRSLTGFDNWFNKENPATQYLPDMQKLQAAAGQPGPPQPGGASLQAAPANELQMARQAIQSGASPQAVKQMMIQRGFSPAGL